MFLNFLINRVLSLFLELLKNINIKYNGYQFLKLDYLLNKKKSII
ncbi:hypothetical protein LALCM10_170178 [Dellaglioa algida]|nr:hypothetical protein LALCM10_170178 [Dellaglioa algida]